jgi:hypothetical protein
VKKLIRLTTLLLLVSGWGLAAGALHVVRTPTRVILVPKDRVGFHDTYVDTRHWTLTNVRQHAAVSARIVAIGKADLLKNAVDNPNGDVQAQLLDAIAHPEPPPPTTQPAIVQKAAAEMHAAAKAVRSIFE